MTSFSQAQQPQAMTPPGTMATISIDIAGLIRDIQKHGLEQTIEAQLSYLATADQALVVVDILNSYQQQEEVAGVVVSDIWKKYIVRERLWNHYQGGEQKFKQDIDYSNFVYPKIEAAKGSELKLIKRKLIAGIEALWERGWESEIGSQTDHLSTLSKHYLEEMLKLASHGMTLSNAGELLRKVVNARASERRKGIRSKQAIMVSDIKKAIGAVKAVSQHYNMEPKECSLIQLTIFLEEGIGALPAAVPEIPQIPQDSNSPPAPPPPSGAQPFAAEVFYSVNFP